MRRFKLGLIVNPFAGIGGEVALKGSDGAQIRQQALRMGAKKLANQKTRVALQEVSALAYDIEIITAAGQMGEDVSRACGFTPTVVYQAQHEQTEAQDTKGAARLIAQHQPDLLLFAGGDGTARNIYDEVGDRVTVLGVPAGCKIHSGVYAITPKSAGRVVAMLVRGEIVSLQETQVKDIDEVQFRQGKVQAKLYGEMVVPSELRYVQGVKMGGLESQELVLADIAAHVIEHMQDHPLHHYIMGSGSTVDAIMQAMALSNTLLGVDLVQDMQLVQSDMTAAQLEASVEHDKCFIVMTLIGGQGHILGRGNQQLSPKLIRQVGRENILLVASKAKLQTLNGRPLVCDSGDSELDMQMAGLISVITGYRDKVLYPVAAPQE